jgi:aspartate kinase
MSSLFTALSGARIPVDMVVQNVAREGFANVSFTVAEDELPAALRVVSSAAELLKVQSVQHTTELSKVSIVGHGMQTHTGVAARMFQILADSGINIRVVTTSEIKISVLIDRTRCSDAVEAVHAGFGLHLPDRTLPDVGQAAIRPASVHAAEPEVVADIVSRLEGMESILVSDVSADTQQSRITVTGLPDDPGVARDVFAAIGEGGVLVDMIIQNVARDGRASISFTVPGSDLDRSLKLLQPFLDAHTGTTLTSDRHICKLTIAGIGLRSHTDVGRRVFRTLAEQQINVEMLNTSEIKLSIVIAVTQADRALQSLRSEFGLS